MRRRRSVRPDSATRRHSRSFASAAGAAAAVSSLAGIAALPGGVGAAPGDDNERNSELAEAQFRVYLLSNTDLRPTDVTCALPPTQDVAGEMLCFALVNGRDTIAALATLESPGTYSFTAISKSDAGVVLAPTTPVAPTTNDLPTTPGGPQTPEQPGVNADQAVLDAVAMATTTEAPNTTEVLLGYNDLLVSVDSYSYDETTSTVQVRATSSATTPAQRDELAWSITDTMAYLWEAESPVRIEGATVQPRLEVLVDDAIYGTPFEVMVRVAEYSIEFEEWLSITTGTNAYSRVFLTVSGPERRASHARRAEPTRVHSMLV